MTRPQNVGIKAIEIYFPNRVSCLHSTHLSQDSSGVVWRGPNETIRRKYVPQPDLEKYMHVSAGKHTIGLGQTNMSFCDDREDINSLALTALSALLHKNAIPPTSIGYLGVGTESLLDRSKSTKTVLMQLFTPEYPDVEGVDSYNACYGGTAALLAAVAWIESSAWDGRDAVVVCGDIAAYAREDAAARPTGGAGCVAMLVGADAPVVVEAGVPRASYMRHAWDFFKADFGREAAFVDGAGSGRCYLEAVDGCYRGWVEKMLALEEEQTKEDEGGRARGPVGVGIDAFDYFLFHAPNCKLVAKAYARLLWNDLLRTGGVPEELRPRGAGLDDESTLGDKGLEKQLMALAQSRFEERVRPGLLVPAQCGNMYTASLYSGLVGLLASVPSERLQWKRIGMFSYGSGLASTLFTLVVRGDTRVMAERLDLHRRLAARMPAAPEVWDEMCRLREEAFQRREYVPRGDVGVLLPGTYYLEYVDEMLRRRYAVKA